MSGGAHGCAGPPPVRKRRELAHLDRLVRKVSDERFDESVLAYGGDDAVYSELSIRRIGTENVVRDPLSLKLRCVSGWIFTI